MHGKIISLQRHFAILRRNDEESHVLHSSYRYWPSSSFPLVTQNDIFQQSVAVVISKSPKRIREYVSYLSRGREGITAAEVTRQLLEIFKIQAENPTPVEVHVNIEIKNKIQGLKSSLDLMREDLLIDVQDEELHRQMKQELDLIAKASDSVSSLSKEDARDSSYMKRIGGFIKKMEDTSTRIGKVVKTMDNGVGYAQDLAGYYNKITEWCGMPHVPSIFLKKK